MSKNTPKLQDAYFVRLSDNKDFFIHPDPSLETKKQEGFKVVEGYIGACVWPKHAALNFITQTKKGNLEIVRFNDVVSSVKNIDKTVVIRYEEACDMINCCYENDEFNTWYEKNEAYFLKKGLLIIENLLKDQNGKFLKYCFTFNFENPKVATFVIYNYYNQKEVCSFTYNRQANDPLEPRIWLDYYDKKLFDDLGGDFKILEKQEGINRKKDHEFMCEHTVEMCFAVMFYFADNKNIEFKDYKPSEQGDAAETDITFKNVTRKYYYTGYVNLNAAKICRINAGELEKEKQKRGEYQRHIQKWSVRGHYRTTKTGKKVWVAPHDKGQGELENRVYGDVDEKDVNVLPKVFEINKTVAVVEKAEKKTEMKSENIAFMTLGNKKVPYYVPEIPTTPPLVKKLSFWQRIIQWIKNYFRISGINEQGNRTKKLR